MKSILNIIINLFSKKTGILKFFYKVISLAEKIITYLQDKRLDKIRKQTDKEIKEAEKKLDNACDSGNLSDLFDATEQFKQSKLKQKELLK